jgi:hypothetical protein
MGNLIDPIKVTMDFYNSEIKTIRAKQYDKKSRYIEITCTNKGVPIALDGSITKCYMKMETPDDRGIYNEAKIQSDGTVLVELTETALAHPGKALLELDFVCPSEEKGNDSLLSTMNLDIIIEKSVYSNDKIIASDEFNALTDLITKEQGRSDSLSELEDSVRKAEEIRVSNETERCNSEEKRKVSEEKRETDTKAAIDKTNEIILSATGALETVKQKAEEVETNATNAAKSESNAKASEQAATKSQETATEKADSALEYATKAQSYAVGGTGSREGEDSDNAKYYYEQSRDISEGLKGGLQPHGTVAFLNLPSLSDVETGWMYNISDEFTTTNDFKEGEGNVVPAGANIYKTSDGKWDVLAGTPVTGVKGAKEDSFRRGNVELTAENVGAVPTDGDTAENTIAFTSSDVTDGSASAWTSVSKLSSGEKHASLFAKVSQMFKNVRYLYKMLGSTGISSIGGGTVTGAISSQNQAFTQHKSSGDHDGRYYTETEINNLLAKKISASQYGAYFIGLQGDYWNIVTENGVKFVTLVNGCCILTSNTTCDIHLDIMLRDNFGIYAGCNPHTHMFNMDSFRSALNMSKLTFDSNQTSVELILSANTINAYDTKELLLAQNHYAGNENFSGLRFTQDGHVTRKYYSSDGKILWGNIYVCQSAAEAQAGTHSVMMHQGNIFRVDIYGAKYA